MTHPKVQDAAVFGVPNEDLGEEVKAARPADALKLAPGGDVEAEVDRLCRVHLANIKCPAPSISRPSFLVFRRGSSTRQRSGIDIGGVTRAEFFSVQEGQPAPAGHSIVGSCAALGIASPRPSQADNAQGRHVFVGLRWASAIDAPGLCGYDLRPFPTFPAGFAHADAPLSPSKVGNAGAPTLTKTS